MSNKSKILIVDDEPMIRRILSTRLNMAGYDVVLANDGEEALTVFKQESPDLIVLDVMMPKLNGLEVCQELRKSTDIPIIMLTALGDVADRITGLQLGADDYLPKPFSPKELEERINAILRRFKKPGSSSAPGEADVPGILQASLVCGQKLVIILRIPNISIRTGVRATSFRGRRVVLPKPQRLRGLAA